MELQALVLAVFQRQVRSLALLEFVLHFPPADYSESKLPIRLVLRLDLIDIARTSLQRANHLLQSPDLIATLSAPLRPTISLHIYCGELPL